MSDSNDEAFLNELRATFMVEAQEHLQTLAAGLIELESTDNAERRQALIETVFREVHSLKGAARAVENRAVEQLCQSMESVLSALKNRRIEFRLQLADLLHAAMDMLAQLLTATAATPPNTLLALCGRLDTAALDTAARRATDNATVDSATANDSATADRASPDAEPANLTVSIDNATAAVAGAMVVAALPDDSSSISTPPPEELPAATETVRIATARLDSLLRQAEGLLTAKLRTEQRALDIEAIAATVAALQKTGVADRHIARVEGDYVFAANAPPARKSLAAFAQQEALAQTLADQLDALAHAAQSDWQLLAGKVDQLLEEIKKISMLPAASALKIFPKLVRDLARAGDKEALLNFSGGDIEVDRRMLEEIRDPLVHLVRNCIDHGIEKPAERERRGKPAQGTITLAIEQRDGGRIEILIADDGAGIDLDKVRHAAQQLQLHSATELANADAAALTAMVFQSGLSTSPLITDLSGRGLGLAIVREKVEKLGGTIAVQSQFGAGTQFRLILPVTLATYRGVHVRIGTRHFVFPTMQVERVATVPRTAIKNVENRPAVVLQGRVVAVVPLAGLLGLPDVSSDAATVSLVVGWAAETRIAFSVDEIVDEQEVLVKGLGEQLLRVRNIAGATRLREGTVALMLNMADLMKSVVQGGHQASRTLVAPDASEARKSILVAEDSITSRMLLKGILESVGYRVTVAVDGEEAFARLHTDTFDLVVSDVDMPRLNGLELTARIRADADLSELPVILVTTLASAQDRERGAEVGASAYLVKSSFEQSNLLEIVRRLL